MSIEIDVDLREIRHATQQLELLEVRLERDVPMVVLEKIAERVIELAKEIVPVDTGRLRASITMKKISETEIVIGSDVEYSIYVELGTSKMSAQPYLIPSLFQALNEVSQEFPQYLQEFVEV